LISLSVNIQITKMIELIAVKADGVIWYYINKEMCTIPSINTESIHFLSVRDLWELTKDKICLEDVRTLIPYGDIDDECISKDITRTIQMIDTYFITFMNTGSIKETLIFFTKIDGDSIPPLISWSQFWYIYYYVCIITMHKQYTSDVSYEHQVHLNKWIEYYKDGIFDTTLSDIISYESIIPQYKIINEVELQ